MRNNNKTSLILISVIMAAVVTALFLVVNVTALFIVAYLFALFAIALFCFGKLYMLANPKSYPWFAAFPLTIFRYLIVQFVLSAVFVAIQNLTGWSINMRWFLLLHIVLFAFFAVLLITMKSGKEIIERRDDEIREKVTALRSMQADVESLARKLPKHEQDLKQVAEALRYSDPMSHPSLAVYEEKIQRGIMAIGTGGEDIAEQCAELLRLVADRNGKCKMLKQVR